MSTRFVLIRFSGIFLTQGSRGLVGEESPLVRAQWTEAILDECFGHIRKNRPDLKPRQLDRTRELINRAVADCLVTGYEQFIEGLTLPDSKDRHVLAAAIRAGAQAIITTNVKDFPEETLATYHAEAIHPDDFVMDLIDLAPGFGSGWDRSEKAKPPA